MQPVRAALPELDRLRPEDIAAHQSGNGTSSPNRASAEAKAASSSSRLSSGALWRDAHAPRRLPASRVSKYASDSGRGTFSTGPVTRTWRLGSVCQRKDRAECGFAASWRPFRLS